MRVSHIVTPGLKPNLAQTYPKHSQTCNELVELQCPDLLTRIAKLAGCVSCRDGLYLLTDCWVALEDRLDLVARQSVHERVHDGRNAGTWEVYP